MNLRFLPLMAASAALLCASALTGCTTIDWFTVWPDDALRHVADQVGAG